MIDFSQPQPETEINLHRIWYRPELIDNRLWYLPRHVSIRNDWLFRVAVNNEQRYVAFDERINDGLNRAFGVLIDMCLTEKPIVRFKEKKSGPPRKMDTGVHGVTLQQKFGIARPRIAILTTQSVMNCTTHNTIKTIAVDKLTQEWLDYYLCVGTAVRAAYRSRRQYETLTRPISWADIEKHTIPDKPVKQITVNDILQWQHEWNTRTGRYEQL